MTKPTAPRPTVPTRRGLLGLTAGAGLTALGACRSGGTPAARAEEEGELDELLADLSDQSDRFEPIRPDERRERVARLARLLNEAWIDAILIEPGATLRYLSDVSWGRSERLFGMVVFSDGSLFWVSPAFEVPRAERTLAEAEAPEGPILGWDEHEHAWKPLAAALRERGVEVVAVEPQARAFVGWELADALAEGPGHVTSGAAIVRALRMQKDEHELALLRGANELTQEAIAAVAELLRPGMTDHEVGALMRRAQERLGLSGVWVLPLLGESAAFPHGRPAGRALVSGELVLVDTGGGLHGYQSDETRTWVFGEPPSADVERAWNTVRDAQQRAYEAIRPGVPAREIDRVARDTITAAGYGEGYAAFAHRLGHGIGLEGHEDPYFDGGSEVVLAPGMTLSDEPGIYHPGRYGIRLEDVVVVTADGADHFGTWQPSPRAPR